MKHFTHFFLVPSVYAISFHSISFLHIKRSITNIKYCNVSKNDIMFFSSPMMMMMMWNGDTLMILHKMELCCHFGSCWHTNWAKKNQQQRNRNQLPSNLALAFNQTQATNALHGYNPNWNIASHTIIVRSPRAHTFLHVWWHSSIYYIIMQMNISKS